MRISDWSSDVCSSDLFGELGLQLGEGGVAGAPRLHHLRAEVVDGFLVEIGRASCRERVCQYMSISVVAVSLTKKKVITTNVQLAYTSNDYTAPNTSPYT